MKGLYPISVTSVTLKKLKEKELSEELISFFLNLSIPCLELNTLVYKLLSLDKFDLANNLIMSYFKTKQQFTLYSIHCAELILPQFEEKFTNDLRPRKAIEAAKEWLREPTEENRKKIKEIINTAAYFAIDAITYAIAYNTIISYINIATNTSHIIYSTINTTTNITQTNPSLKKDILDYGLSLIYNKSN